MRYLSCVELWGWGPAVLNHFSAQCSLWLQERPCLSFRGPVVAEKGGCRSTLTEVSACRCLWGTSTDCVTSLGLPEAGACPEPEGPAEGAPDPMEGGRPNRGSLQTFRVVLFIVGVPKCLPHKTGVVSLGQETCRSPSKIRRASPGRKDKSPYSLVSKAVLLSSSCEGHPGAMCAS